MPPRPTVLLASLVVLTHVAAAMADDSPAPVGVRLTLDAPAGCLDHPSFLAQLQARSARIRDALPNERAPSMHIELVGGEGQVFGKLTVRGVDGDEGHRELLGTDCESVASGLALVAVVILDPAAVLAAAASASASAPAASPATPPADLAKPSRAPTRPSPQLSLGWALATAWGLGPDPQILPRAFIDLELPALPAGPSARLSVGRGFTRAVETPSGTADITLTDARFEPCLDVWSPATFRARACGIVVVGVLSGEGRNTTHANSETRASVELGFGLRPTWRVRDGIALALLIAATGPLARYRFYFDNPYATAYRLAAWSAVGELSLGIRFW
jgi:hypothetical protein